ncbi:glycosyltransferase family 2 protein [Streptococcus sp. zg-JUN1979]|uniref:glycosyltransferase family 2 protein n=1 Tax=Streptococcus sp. zg-JUN1979 TaxID=3391450 RepID=UPI0039A716A5
MQKLDLVSVVVTCYNHKDYIEKCLKSIFNQSYSSIELFVWNDGSTDGSGEVIERVLEDSPFKRTEYYVHDNQGLVATRNKAFQQISGNFLLFMDSDNFLEENYIEELVKKAQETEADIVYTSLVNPETKDIVLEVSEFSLSRLYRENFIDSCSLVRVNKIADVRFDHQLNYKKLEDYDFFFNLIVTRGAKAVPCYTTHLNYRVLSTSISNRENFVYYYETYAYILGKYLTYHPDLASDALAYHFSQISHFDIEHSIKEEDLKLYLSDNESFAEEPDFQKKIFFEDIIEIPITKKVTHIKIRPSNIPSFYEKFSLVHQPYNTELLPVLSNGILDARSVIFSDFYPFLEYRVNLSEGDSLKLCYKRYNINDIVADDYIAKVLAREKKQLNSNIKSLEDAQLDRESEVVFYRQALEEVTQKYEKLLSDYQSLTESILLRKPSKFTHFLRRNK